VVRLFRMRCEAYPTEKGRQRNAPLRRDLGTQETLVNVVDKVAAVLARVAVIRVAWCLATGIVLVAGDMRVYHADGGSKQEE
jgi:hypothetical protein